MKTVHNKSNTNELIQKAIKKHENKYNYSLVEYSNAKEKIKIICKKHGIFWQIPNDHLTGTSCPKCAREKSSKNGFKPIDTDGLLDRFNKMHDFKYDYSHINYKSQHEKIKIKCQKHVFFWQLPRAHLKAQECPKCALEQKKHKIIEIMEKQRKSSFLLKKVILPSGNEVFLQGNEPIVLKQLLNDYCENEILSGFRGVPHFEYIDKNNKKRKYFPDFLIVPTNKSNDQKV